ncbi:MAG TPA: hypothetical protein VMP01_25855 [Pirellulaceae bacterium]|nr:hypothetical protein [Pirellulaceae bacterium]
MRYENIVFFQGSEADRALAILDEHGPEAAIEHLTQYHEPGKHEVIEQPWGDADQRFVGLKQPGYVLTCNWKLHYIGLAAEV